MLSSIQARREQLTTQAERTFRNHVLKEDPRGEGSEVRSWYASNPRHASSWFRLIMAPTAIIFHGDVESAIYRVRETGDLIPWLRKATEDIDQLLGRAEVVTPEYVPAAAQELIRELEGQGGLFLEKARLIKEQAGDGAFDEEAFVNAYNAESGDIERIQMCYDWKAGAFVQHAALRWFLGAVCECGPGL